MITVNYTPELTTFITYRKTLYGTGWPKSYDPNVRAYSSEIFPPLELTLGQHNATVNHSRI